MSKIHAIAISIILTIGSLFPILPTLANPNPNIAQVKPVVVSLTGTIHKLAVEGTCYQLDSDNGKKYELIGKFPKIDGTRVQVSGIIDTDTATICQVGQVVKVKNVRVIR